MPAIPAARCVLVASALSAAVTSAGAPARAPSAAAAGPWSAWAGGECSGSPSIVRHAGRLEAYALGADGSLVRRTADAGAWGTWTSLGGRLASEPVAIAVADHVEVFCRGTDDAAWMARVDASGVAWSSLGGRIASSVAVARGSSADEVTLVVIGTDGRTWANDRRGSSWTGWSAVAHAAGATPAPAGASWPLPAPLDVQAIVPAACPAGLTRCGSECVDTRSDARHCGRCDHPCAGGACSNGACSGEGSP